MGNSSTCDIFNAICGRISLTLFYFPCLVSGSNKFKILKKNNKKSINTIQNSNLKPEAAIYTIDSNKSTKKYIGATSRKLNKRMYEIKRNLLENNILVAL